MAFIGVDGEVYPTKQAADFIGGGCIREDYDPIFVPDAMERKDSKGRFSLATLLFFLVSITMIASISWSMR